MERTTEIWTGLRSLLRLYDHMLKDVCKEHGLTLVEAEVVSFLRNNPKKDTAADIVELRMISKGAVSKAVEELIRKSLLERIPDTEDRRRIHLKLRPEAVPVTESINTGTIYSSGTFTGGITGRAEDSQEVPITRCRNAGSVQGADNTGGITGQGSAELCGNEGEVSGNSYVGGISGENSRGYIRNSYNWGTVEGNGYVGGVIGSIRGFGGNVEDCYSTGQITGSQNTGGVIGYYENNGPLGTNYYMAGTAQKGVGGGKDGPALPKEEGQFASGEVAWKLNQGGTDGSQFWYQDLDNGEEKDRFPVFEGGTVYPGTDCVTYTNTKPEGEISRQHDFGEGSNGFCKKCGQYQEAEKNQDDIYEISNGGQLYWFAALVNGDSSNAEIREKDTHADGMLTVDITVNPEPVTGEDLSGNLRTWEPAGSEGASVNS